ncbi:MAG: hypothetical protein JO095_10845 [Alphaproteobacteria bacterium]|nr:hypothetical protein [Alphaproteobacteria bacterium]
MTELSAAPIRTRRNDISMVILRSVSWIAMSLDAPYVEYEAVYDKEYSYRGVRSIVWTWTMRIDLSALGD